MVSPKEDPPPADVAKEDDDEELQTMAQKETWLRARGVEIESVEDRRIAALAKKERASAHPLDHVEGITRRVKYVKIPCDSTHQLEQLFAVLAHDAHGDVLPDVLAPRFAGGGSVDGHAAREQAVRQLGEKGLELSQSAIENATKLGNCETFALVRPSHTNGHRGFYLYLDEVGLLKKLPANERANQLAVACGFANVSFYGDMFIGSVLQQPSPMHNTDFLVQDMDSSTDWLKRAVSENLEYNASMQALQDAMRDKGGMVGGGSSGGGMPGGVGEGYTWSQTDDEIELTLIVPDGTKAKDLVVGFKPKSVTVALKDVGGTFVDVPNLYRKTRPDESTWTVDSGRDGTGTKVVVTIAKVDEQVWHSLEGI